MLRFLLQILFPSPCVSCGYLGDLLCDSCFHSLPFKPHRREVHGLWVSSAFIYEKASLLDKLIHPFKYQHQADAFRYFVPQMVHTLKLFDFMEDLVFVPVPLHPSRHRERGYNQSELLAKWLARRVGGRLWTGLKRRKNTGSQALLSRKEDRQKNMEGAFEVLGPVPSCRQMILVDDIVTSGSTLLACRDVLLAKGVHSLSALTLADRELQPSEKTRDRH